MIKEKEELTMTNPEDKLKKLAEERKEHNPFEKIDELEKEYNLDEEPQVSEEEEVDEHLDKVPIEEDPIVQLAMAEQRLHNNQTPK
jgi:hypothetical protein